MTRLLNRPCTLTLNSQADTAIDDGYGNETPGEPPTMATVCELQQQRRAEPAGQGELSDTVWSLFLPPDTEIGTADIVTIDDQDYEMVGDPWPVKHPRTGRASHVEATVRRAS